MNMIIEPKALPVPKLQGYLQGLVAPRPIAFVSSVNRLGQINLSPFSFFNLFSMNPPVLVFSPSRRVRDNTIKHTLENIEEVPEVTINVVSYAMVQQTSLASCEYPKGINEFEKAGFSAKKSKLVLPPCVAESPASFECRVNQVIPLGREGGAGNLVICEVLLIHVDDTILDEQGRVDPFKLDAVARMGNNFYCRAQADQIFEVAKPNEKLGMGFDQLPPHIKNSMVLTGNDLGQLANIEKLPSLEAIDKVKSRAEVQQAMAKDTSHLHLLAQEYLRAGMLEEAWCVLLISPN